MRELLVIILGSILVKNVMLSRIMGTCPYIGVSSQVETATGMGIAVVFVMSVASAVTWLVQNQILVPLEITYLQTVAGLRRIYRVCQGLSDGFGDHRVDSNGLSGIFRI